MVKSKDRRGVNVPYQSNVTGYRYLKIRVDGAKKTAKLPLTPLKVKMTILTAMKSLFGEVGKATPVCVLKVDATSGEILIRAHASTYKRVCQALALHPSYDGAACAFHTVQSSTNLISMAAGNDALKISPAS